MAGERDLNRDLTLSPDSYLYLQNVGKGGLMSVYVGPAVVNQTGQDQPVRYDPNSHQYKTVPTLEQAVQQCPRANEGDYIVLENPSEKGTFPSNTSQQAEKLSKGRKIVIPGPFSEALWPGQSAQVIEGHRLRSNQYLLAVVYNAEEAQRNWDKAVIKPQDAGSGAETGSDNGTPKSLPKPEHFGVGTRIIIKGTDVSFYIPCTGIEILADNGKYVREAVTLEQGEYCCLVDESGQKEYPRGPKVVFPRPTQVFDTDSKGRRKFRPIELNTINGIHIKITADYEGEDLEQPVGQDSQRLRRKYQEGEELFVTGKTYPVYYPREEHQIVEYGQGNKKHFSTAIPKGEGRYVIDRETGRIRLVKGPVMFLPDPRREILVRRVLSEDECRLMYPDSPDALAYNRDLSQAIAESPSGRSGVVSEGDYRKRQLKNKLSASPHHESLIASDDYSVEEVGDQGGAAGTITRGTKYQGTRQITLNTKYDGVPRVEIWSGYAVQVVGAEGNRRVVEGPNVLLLEYDEKLGFVELSTGKPKSTDKLFRTVYLGVRNNQVGDIISFESKDHVKGKIKVSLRVNFEAETEEDKLKWFSVSNYVKYLTDHVRSILAGMTKKHTVADIKANYVQLVRDAILGQKTTSDGVSESLRTTRPGLAFSDNGMRVVEVEVLDLSLEDPQIAKMLDQTQHMVVQTNIQLEQMRKEKEHTEEKERIDRDILSIQHETAKVKRELEAQTLKEQLILLEIKLDFELKGIAAEAKKQIERDSMADATETAKLARAKAEFDQILLCDGERQKLKLEELDAETKAAVERMQAAKDGLSEALVALSRDDLAAKLAQAVNIERYISGDDMGSAINRLLSFAPSILSFMEKGKDGKMATKNRLNGPEAIAAK